MIDEGADTGSRERASAGPYVMTIGTPAGMPWDQWRLARLEAENSSPLPLDQLRYALRRIGRWRPGQPGRFAGAFFHRDGVRGEQAHVQELDGVELQFLVRDEASTRAARIRRWTPLACISIAAVSLLAAFPLALADRNTANTALELLRQQAQRNLAARENARRQHAENISLAQVGARGSSLANALDDIGWLARARDPASGIVALEWTPDGLLISSAGPSNPIAAKDRTITPASAPGPVSQWIASSPEERAGAR